jgi:hypothetical protein
VCILSPPNTSGIDAVDRLREQAHVPHLGMRGQVFDHGRSNADAEAKSSSASMRSA